MHTPFSYEQLYRITELQNYRITELQNYNENVNNVMIFCIEAMQIYNTRRQGAGQGGGAHDTRLKLNTRKELNSLN